MRSQEALRPGVAILAAALLALAWIPAAAAPAGTIVNVNELLPAGYMVDNPCTTAVTEKITLQGTFHITGSLTFYESGTTDVNLVITPALGGTDMAGVNYKSDQSMNAGFGRFPPKRQVGGTSYFKVIPDGSLPYFWLKVRFVINRNGNPTGDNSNGMVTFSPVDSTGASTTDGFDGVQCPH